MEDKTLTILSIIISLLGLTTLIIINENITLKTTQISEIDKTLLDQTLKIKGNIISISNIKENKFLKLKDNTGEIDIIIFIPWKICTRILPGILYSGRLLLETVLVFLALHVMIRCSMVKKEGKIPKRFCFGEVVKSWRMKQVICFRWRTVYTFNA